MIEKKSILVVKLPLVPKWQAVKLNNKKYVWLASVAGAVIEATARPDLEDFLRTRSPGEVING